MARSRKKVDPRRLAEVEGMLLAQMLPGQIARVVAEKYGVAERTIRFDIEHVLTQFEQDSAQRMAARRNVMRMTMRNLYQRQIKASAWAAAGHTLDRLCKLDGLFKPTELSLDIPDLPAAATAHALTSQRQRGAILDLLSVAGERAAAARAASAATAEATAAATAPPSDADAEPVGLEDEDVDADGDFVDGPHA